MGPLEFLYYLGYSLKKSRSLKSRKRLPHRVISVGNLTVGGTGKTPAVIAIAEEARNRGYRPCILTRGYGGKAAGPCFVTRGVGPLLSVDDAGDEALLMAEILQGVPIVKGRDRYEAGMFAIDHLPSPASHVESPFLFILDDGYQHWGLFRDTDILLIDNTNPFGNKRLLPLGILREPLTEMKRADVIVMTRVREDGGASPSDSALLAEIRRYNPLAPIYRSEHIPVSLRTAEGNSLPVTDLAGRPVLAFCGIGNPSSFRETLTSMQAEVRRFMAFMDHHKYRSQDMQRIIAAARECDAHWIVTTEKDIMRLKDFDLSENMITVRIRFRAEKGFYDEVLPEG